ncbi:MAG: putative transporter integral rane protein [Actinomycetia bacterium]|nr:putative transporter integral rane protein [Actinomycetes bacterium]
MIRSYQAELVKLARRKVLLITAAAVVVFAVGGALIVLTSVKPAAQAGPGRALSLEQLAGAGGGTQIFRTAASFAGTFLFVIFVGVVAAEFSRGTIRTMLLRQPRRVRLLAGKLAALLTFAAVALAATETITWITARALAPGHDVATHAWTTLNAAGAAFTDFGAVMLWITGYAVLGMAVAILLRSVPLALAVGIGWAGPFEHLVQNAWTPAAKVFPGLLLEAFVAGGTTDISAGQALARIAVYATIAAAIGAVVFARRDVTA